MNLYYSLILSFDSIRVGQVGDFEAATPVVVESSLKYHPCIIESLTVYLESGIGTVSGG